MPVTQYFGRRVLGLLLDVRRPGRPRRRRARRDGAGARAPPPARGGCGRPSGSARKASTIGPDGALDDVVGQHDEHRVALGEVRGQAERLGDAARLLLVGVGQLVDAVLVPVAEQPQELAGMRAAGDQHDLVDAARHHRLDRPGDHRAVVDRQQVLVGDAGQRVQARTRAPGQDDTLHDRASVRSDDSHGELSSRR